MVLPVDHAALDERGRLAALLAEGGPYEELYRTQFAEPSAADAAEAGPLPARLVG